MKTENEINQKLKEEKELMEYYGKQVRDFVAEYGNRNCDYVQYRKDMEFYHRTIVNTLIEILR